MGPDDFRPLEDWGHDAMWLDNLHHELHVLLTGEHDGYYAHFGSLYGLVRELTRPAPERLVVCAQNHDQVGNRALGDRLPPDAHRVALAVVLFSPEHAAALHGRGARRDGAVPVLHGSHRPADRRRDARGAQREFASFTSFSGEEVPDPQALETLRALAHHTAGPDPFYAELIGLRRALPRSLDVSTDGRVLTLRRGTQRSLPTSTRRPWSPR